MWQPWVQRPIRMVVWGVPRSDLGFENGIAAFITFVCIVVNAGRRTNIVGSGKVDTTDVEPSDGPGVHRLIIRIRCTPGLFNSSSRINEGPTLLELR